MAITVASCHSVLRVDWSAISMVLLDMDGTLLDLRFDNDFWLRQIPQTYAEHHGMSVAQAEAFLNPIFQREAGKLNWYCLDFWSGTVGFDVAALKRQLSHGIGWRPEAADFLAKLRASHCQVALITNAHPETLKIKLEQVQLATWFDHIVSSHQFGAPKESQQFWRQLAQTHPFDPASTLFIDDSEAVLKAADMYGIAHLITLRQPDSTGPIRSSTEFPAIHHFNEIFDGMAHAV